MSINSHRSVNYSDTAIKTNLHTKRSIQELKRTMLHGCHVRKTDIYTSECGASSSYSRTTCINVKSACSVSAA